jgi:hypothetical protein
MFRASSCSSSGATTTAVAASGLPSDLGDSSAVGRGRAGRPDHDFTPGKVPVPIVQEAGWAPRPVWTGAENLAPTGIRSLDHPACSQSLHRLSYQAHNMALYCHIIKAAKIHQHNFYLHYLLKYVSTLNGHQLVK